MANLKDSELSYDVRLRTMMTAAGLSSYRALAAKSGVSVWQIGQLRAGKGAGMRLEMLSELAAALQVSLTALLSTFELLPPGLKESQAAADRKSVDRALADLRREYARLKGQMEETEAVGRSHLKTEALQALESWLVQWPTIAKRAENNESLAAVKVLPFVRPVEKLMEEWGVRAIALVDAEVEYNPQLHQLVGGVANAGDRVRVTHSGSLYEGNLLHRAKVKRIDS